MIKLQQFIRGSYQQQYWISTNRHKTVQLEFIHNQPGSQSRINLLIIAKGQARVDIRATVVIAEQAVRSTTWLDIRVITTDKATVKAVPGLKIANNLVQAGHSLSTRHLAAEELFYLTSRGLTKRQAEQLVIDEISSSYQKGIKL